MKIAIVYNRDSQDVINLFGVPNRERYGLKAIKRITDALKKGGHRVMALEGDKQLIVRLEEFMPRVLQGERPGMVFNLSYGIQGQARYTHVPGMLEMIGIPYVGSGPLAHSLSLDKVVAKMIFRQHGLPTPNFAVLYGADFEAPSIPYPMIVKPKNESTSFGLKVVHDEAELRAAAQVIFDKFGQPVLAEEYIDGREINVGILGNSATDVLPPAELDFGDGPRIYTLEDKQQSSGREVAVVCPADLTPQQAEEAQALARRAFECLGCSDCARVDMRLSPEGQFSILEINSLPSLGEHGSYTHAAEAAGLDFAALVNRLVEVASARYFGTPAPPSLDRKSEPRDKLFAFVTERRDRLEARVEDWVGRRSRTQDPLGLRAAFRTAGERLEAAGLRIRAEADSQLVRVWESPGGLEGGTLLVAPMDVALPTDAMGHGFRREPEWLVGEGIGSSRAPLVVLEFGLRALKAQHLHGKVKLGVVLYGDEGADWTHSAETIGKLAARAREVLVLTPGPSSGKIVTGRRGSRRYRLTVQGDSRRFGQAGRKPDPLTWLSERLPALTHLTDRKNRLAVGVTELRSTAHATHLPHLVTATVMLSYPRASAADGLEARVRETLGRGLPWELELIADRPPLLETKASKALAQEFVDLAAGWQIPLSADSSAQPSVAGLIPSPVPALCGLGPAAMDLLAPQERIQRMSLVQRTLLLAEFLCRRARESKATPRG
jgi:D-alanine-D-alanine ligase